MSLGAATVKKCFLELGGKSPNIVLEDADFARGIGMSTFMVCLHGGQGCATLSRLLLPASRFEEGVELAAQQLSSMKYGDPTVTGNIMGRLNSARQSARLKKAEMPAESSIGTIGTPYGAFLAYRRDHPADDFLSTLIEARFTDVFTGEECGLTYQEILNYVGMLYAAGNETTARLIGWMGKILAEHPDQRAAVVADPSLVPAAVEETLRFEVPSPIQIRALAKPAELYGQTVPEGATMALLTGSANRDERAFDSPDTFDVHRKIDRHVTFGVGAELIHTSTLRGYRKLPIVL